MRGTSPQAHLANFGDIIAERQAVKPMGERIQSFLADVLALEGEDESAIRVRVALTDYEQIFRAQEVNKRMKDKAARACVLA